MPAGLRLALTLACGLLATGLARATEYHVLADPDVNFADVDRFRIGQVTISRSGGATVPPASVEGLREVVRNALLNEDLLEDKDRPDVTVEIRAGLEVPLESRDTQDMPYFDGATWQVLPREESESDPVPPAAPARFGQGTLRIDLRRVRDGRIIWRGTVEDAVQVPVSRQQATRAVELLMTHYPPPSPRPKP